MSTETTSQAPSAAAGFALVDLGEIPPEPCPCGSTRRAFLDLADYPLSVHRVEIGAEARSHYHRRLTETYYFLDCQPGAAMELDGQLVPVRAGMCLVIRPLTRHRAVGRMTILNIVSPKFDPADEWFD